MIAFVVLLAATALCALIVHFGPTAAEAMLPLLGEEQEENLPAIETVYTVVIFGSLLAFGLIGGALARVNPLRPGERPLQSTIMGLVLGLVGIFAATGFASLAGTLSRPGAGQQEQALLWGTAVVLLQSSSEEVYFRGWLQPVLAEQWGGAVAVVLGALTFAGLHLMGEGRSPVTIVNLFLGGLLFGAIALYRGGIAGAVAAHFVWNWSEQLVLGLVPNPGIGSFGSIYDLELSGASAWGGSEEGLNASIAMTLALLAVLVPLLILIRNQVPKPIPPAGSG